MTTLYFVRHAQPDYRTGDNPTFALSEEGEKDALSAADHLKDIRFDAADSSPYRRSIDTIRPIILSQKLKLKTDIRLRERDNAGRGSNTPEMFRRRWNDFDYHEAGGESLRSTQDRNIAAVSDILHEFTDKTVLIGTHGTALAVILNYYDPSFGLNGFLRMIDFMPCIIRMTFDGAQLSEQKELFYIKKEFHGVTD